MHLTSLLTSSPHCGLARARFAGLAVLTATVATSVLTVATAAPSAALLTVLAPSVSVQERARPDQIYIRNVRTGRASVVSGTVTANGLDEVVITMARGGDTKVDSAGVDRILWGEVPPSFRDGRTYFERGDWESAAKEFRLAAGDASAREVVQAAARLRAAQALLRSGALEPTHFSEAVQEARTFLADYPANRDVPVARMAEARALLLAGKPADAGAAYRGVFSELSGDSTTDGYGPGICMRAGLLAARSMLAAQDTLAAREIMTSIGTSIGPMIDALDSESALRVQLAAIRDEVALGEGLAELAAGNSKPALTFFQNELTRQDSSSSETSRMVASLGLAEALLAEDQFLEAEYLFATVSALDHGGPDRVALAQLRMAQCELQLQQSRSKERARTLLQSVINNHGDSPSAPAARDVLSTL